MAKLVGGKKCSCGDGLDISVVHHYDATPCYVIGQEDLNNIIDGVASALQDYDVVQNNKQNGIGDTPK